MLLRVITTSPVVTWISGLMALSPPAAMPTQNCCPTFPPLYKNFARHQPLFWDERVRPRAPVADKAVVLLVVPCIVITDKTADLSEYCQPNTGPG